MGETSLSCHASPEACCLGVHENIIVLIALIVLVQLALKLVTVICYYIWYLLESVFEIIFSNASRHARAITPTTRPRRAHYRRPAEQLSQQDLPHRHRRSENHSLGQQSIHCTLEPLRLMLDMQRDEPHALKKHPHSTRRCCNCECECHPRSASAPTGYHVTRYKDVACGTSDTMLKTGGNAMEGQGGPPSPKDPYQRMQVGETPYHSTGHDADFSPGMGLTRSRRPAKVYIYPVHPQTPPGSRGTSPERSHRRRNTPVPTPEELRGSYEPHELRRKVRDAEEQLGLSSIPPRYRSMAASPGRVQPVMSMQGDPKQRLFMTEPVPNSPAQDWVYRSVK